MIQIGLTGGIACGKSTVAAMLAEHGAQIHSADADARAVLLEPGVQAAVFAAFPSVEAADGTLDRAALGKIIFADADARRRLEAILHPLIAQRIRAVLESARAVSSPGVLVYEIPLLFENGWETEFNATLAVVASPETQTARLQERERGAGRPPLTPESIADRLAAQLPVSEKARRANYVVNTDGTMDDTRAQVAAFWHHS